MDARMLTEWMVYQMMAVSSVSRSQIKNSRTERTKQVPLPMKQWSDALKDATSHVTETDAFGSGYAKSKTRRGRRRNHKVSNCNSSSGYGEAPQQWHSPGAIKTVERGKTNKERKQQRQKKIFNKVIPSCC